MILTDILNNNPDGVSIKRSRGDYSPVYYKRGYWVGLTHYQMKPDDHKNAEIYIDTLAKSLHLKRYFYGWWKDQKTNTGYFDLAIHTNNKLEAKKLCKRFDQLAYFDCYKTDSVYV